MLRSDVGDALHEFLVLALGVVDHSDGGLRDRGKRRRFAGMIHSDLDCGRGVGEAQAQYRQRQADLVVEVAGRSEHIVGAELHPQDGRGEVVHLLDREEVGVLVRQHRRAAQPTRHLNLEAAPLAPLVGADLRDEPDVVQPDRGVVLRAPLEGDLELATHHLVVVVADQVAE